LASCHALQRSFGLVIDELPVSDERTMDEGCRAMGKMFGDEVAAKSNRTAVASI